MTARNTQIKELDRETKVVFTCIGCYLSEIYFLHLYLKAVEKKRQQKVKNDTEGYREAVRLFLAATKSKKRNEVFAGMIKNIAPLFHAKGKIFTTAEVINCIAKELIPNDYYTNLTNDDKNRLVMRALFSIIEQFTALIYTEYITDIIDRRKYKEEVENKIMVCIIELLTATRDKYYWKFAETNHRRPDGDADKMLFQKVRREATFYKEEFEEAKKTIASYEKIITEMKKAIDVRDALIRKRADEKRIVDAELVRLRRKSALLQAGPVDAIADHAAPERLRMRPTAPVEQHKEAPRSKLFRPGSNITLDDIETTLGMFDDADAADDADDAVDITTDTGARADGANADEKQALEDVLNNREVKEEEEFLERALQNTRPKPIESSVDAPPKEAVETSDADALKTRTRKPHRKSKKEVVNTAPGIFDGAPDL